MSVNDINLRSMSAYDIIYDDGMVRWQPGAGGRLQQAAMELFVEHGYEGTTVADIATRAGLTERTFFRHYADKREVLFAGQELLTELVLGALTDRPPLDAVTDALAATTEMFTDDRRAGARVRQSVIDSHAELRERELIKLARLADAMARALRSRGVADPTATLAADTGIAVFRSAFARWVRDDGGRGLDVFVRDTLAELKAVAGD